MCADDFVSVVFAVVSELSVNRLLLEFFQGNLRWLLVLPCRRYLKNQCLVSVVRTANLRLEEIRDDISGLVIECSTFKDYCEHRYGRVLEERDVIVSRVDVTNDSTDRGNPVWNTVPVGL